MPGPLPTGGDLIRGIVDCRDSPGLEQDPYHPTRKSPVTIMAYTSSVMLQARPRDSKGLFRESFSHEYGG